MKYRKLDSNGDYSIGNGNANFHINTPDAVGQAVLTRLKLWQGEWFLDITQGTPYDAKILGMGRFSTYDFAIQDVILSTVGVTEITDYKSFVNPDTRSASFTATINTIYGATAITL